MVLRPQPVFQHKRRHAVRIQPARNVPPFVCRRQHPVSATRRNKRFTRYFSDQPNGQRKALQAARAYRDKLLSRLPPPRKTKITNKRNTTGVIGVCRQEVLRKSGRWFARYIAEWPKSDGTTGTASFSVNLYGEEDAFELAVYCRRKGLRELGLPRAYYF